MKTKTPFSIIIQHTVNILWPYNTTWSHMWSILIKKEIFKEKSNPMQTALLFST